jgi:hypothetical protein
MNRYKLQWYSELSESYVNSLTQDDSKKYLVQKAKEWNKATPLMYYRVYDTKLNRTVCGGKK